MKFRAASDDLTVRGDLVTVGPRGRAVWEVMSINSDGRAILYRKGRRFGRGEVRTAALSELREPRKKGSK